MLEELLKRKRESITQKVMAEEGYIRESAQLQQEIQELRQRLADDQKNKKRAQTIADNKKRKPVRHYLNYIFSKKYRKNIKDINANLLDDGQEERLSAELQKKEAEHARIEGEISTIASLKVELQNMGNMNYAIKKIIREDPTVLENQEFMIDLVNYNPRAIIYDRTNSDQVFIAFFQKALEIAEQYYEQVKDDQDESKKVNSSISTIRSMLEELNNPNSVPRNLPHFYLYEAIKKSAHDILDKGQNDYICISLTAENNSFEFNEVNNKLDDAFIKRIADLYNDENSTLYFHETHITSSQRYCHQNVFRQGLRLRKEYGNDLSRTMVSQNDIGLMRICGNILNNWESIIVSIPKDEAAIGIVPSEGNNMILPQYVVGAMLNNKKTGEIIWVENDVPVSERVTYDEKTNGTYKDRRQTPIIDELS